MAIVLVLFTGYTIVSAAPSSRLERTMVPEADSTYYLGTTSPATIAWRALITDEVCLTADTCRTSWPGAATFPFATSTTPTHGQLSYWTSSGAYPETLGSVATTTLTFSGPFNGFSALGALVGGTSSTITWTGLATTTALSANQVLYASSASGVTGSNSFVFDGTTNTLSLENGTTTATTTIIGYGLAQIAESGSTYFAKQAVRSDDANVGAATIYERNATTCPLFGCGIWNYRSRGDRNTKTIVQGDDWIGSWYNAGFDGTDYEPAAMIRVEVDGSPGNNDMPGRLTFWTTSDGSNTLTERMRIDAAGKLTVPGSLDFDSYTSAILLTGAGGDVAEYAGSSNPCTNQLPTTISALGALGGCTSVSNAMLSNSTISGIALGSNLADLTATNSTLTFSGTYNGSTARTIGLNLGNANAWTELQTFALASSTQFSAASETFYINSIGRVSAKDTTNNWSGVLSPTKSFVLGTGTTTTWTASTTGTGYSPFLIMPFAGTLRQVRCATDASFLGVNVQVNGSNATPSYFVASTTVGLVGFSAGNTFSAGQKILANFGTTTTASTLEINCTFDVTETL